MKNDNHLIIGGAPKSGTTSLYKYFADHPEVCASSTKETRFFIDPDSHLKSAIRFDGQNLDAYAGFFSSSGKKGLPKLYVEASPDYLYSKTALQIAALLPKSKILFILRDPVDRMVSWYKYARQRRMIDENLSFADYVDLQVSINVTVDTPIHLCALDQGRYQHYIKPFQEAFGDRCVIVDFQNLKNNPFQVMEKMCVLTGISPDFFKSYQFKVENVSRVRQTKLFRVYAALRSKMVYALHNHPKTMHLLKVPNAIIKGLLFNNEARRACEVEVTDEVRETIMMYSVK